MAAPQITPSLRIVDPAAAKAIERLETFVNKTTPIARFEYHTVTFGAANTDTDLVHTLAPRDPEAVQYFVTKISAGGVVYNDQGAGRLAWTPTVIRLRCSAANAVATLLLFVEPA